MQVSRCDLWYMPVARCKGVGDRKNHSQSFGENVRNVESWQLQKQSTRSGFEFYIYTARLG